MIHYGAAYYPEQETPEDIEADAARMQAIGFNAARLGEFAWCRFEPQDGVFDFAWFDHALETLGRHGVRSVVCTPSACPPRWLVDKHPEILYRDQRGVVRPFGGRRHYCYNNPTYRQFCGRIAEELGHRYGASPHVIGFHIDNELGQEATGRCACNYCLTDFQGWLQRRYGTIEAFNRLAGTIFWGQTYRAFNSIKPPLKSIEPCAEQSLDIFADNPTLRLDWERYCSAGITAFQNHQVTALRPLTKLPLTTNATGFWTNANDLHQSFQTLDVAGGDIYPSPRSTDMYGATCDFAFHRGLKPSRGKFWVLETTSGGGQGVWSRQGIPQPFPGTLRMNAILAAACDAELITYFQYKMFRYGAEQLEAAVIEIDGVPRRREREFTEAAQELRALAPLLAGSRVANDVAIVFDYDSLWASKIKPFARSYAYQGQIQNIQASLAARGVGCDIIPLGEGLKDYRLVIVPTPVILSEQGRGRLQAYVAGGGTLLTNFLAGIKGTYNTAERASVPAGLTGLFGMRVAEGEPVLRDGNLDTSAQVRFTLPSAASSAAGGETVQGRNQHWTESLELQGAEVLARYVDTYRTGEAVATRMRHGQGSAIYLGTWMEDEAASGAVLAWAAREAGVTAAPMRFPRGFEAVRRRGAEGDFYMVFNCREQPGTLSLDAPMRELRDGRRLQGAVEMPAKSWLVLAAG